MTFILQKTWKSRVSWSAG